MKSTIQLKIRMNFHRKVLIKRSDNNSINMKVTIGNDLMNPATSFIDTDFFWFSLM